MTLDPTQTTTKISAQRVYDASKQHLASVYNGRLVGQGNERKVLLGIDNVTGKELVFKVLNKDQKNKEFLQKFTPQQKKAYIKKLIFHEIKYTTHYAPQSPYVVRPSFLQALYINNSLPCSVYPYIEAKTVYQYLKQKPNLSKRLSTLFDVGLQINDHFSKTTHVHSDFTSKNILIDEQNKFYLIDCGGARTQQEVNLFLNKTRLQPMKDGIIKTLLSTWYRGHYSSLQHGEVSFAHPFFRAPEQQYRNCMTKAYDIYTSTLSLYQLCTGQIPFHKKITQQLIESPHNSYTTTSDIPVKDLEEEMETMLTQKHFKFSFQEQTLQATQDQLHAIDPTFYKLLTLYFDSAAYPDRKKRWLSSLGTASHAILGYFFHTQQQHHSKALQCLQQIPASLDCSATSNHLFYTYAAELIQKSIPQTLEYLRSHPQQKEPYKEKLLQFYGHMKTYCHPYRLRKYLHPAVSQALNAYTDTINKYAITSHTTEKSLVPSDQYQSLLQQILYLFNDVAKINHGIIKGKFASYTDIQKYLTSSTFEQLSRKHFTQQLKPHITSQLTTIRKQIEHTYKPKQEEYKLLQTYLTTVQQLYNARDDASSDRLFFSSLNSSQSSLPSAPAQRYYSLHTYALQKLNVLKKKVSQRLSPQHTLNTYKHLSSLCRQYNIRACASTLLKDTA